MVEFNDPRPVEISLGDAHRIFAVLCTGTYMPSMFTEVRDIMMLLDSKFGEINEAANGTDDNGEDSQS